MADIDVVMSWLEGLAEPDWRLFHSDSEVQNIAKKALELLKEQKEELDELEPPKKWVVCKACGHKLRNDWVWCPWCRWEIRQGYNADELS